MNGITMWRLDPRISPEELVRHTHRKACTNRAKSGRLDSGQTMAKQGQSTTQGLEGLTAAAKDTANTNAAGKGLPPVHLWNPPFCGDLDMRIASDGTWFYLKTPIGRPALVKLFAAVLKREGDKYLLVSPVEKGGLTVDDAPFLAVELKVEHGTQGQSLNFRTNVD